MKGTRQLVILSAEGAKDLLFDLVIRMVGCEPSEGKRILRMTSRSLSSNKRK
jgi:hypothetical protein